MTCIFRRLALAALSLALASLPSLGSAALVVIGQVAP